jgi:DNA gyrase subunit A
VNGKGEAAAVAVHTLPESEKLSEGVLFNKITPLKEQNKPVSGFSLSKRSNYGENTCLLTVSKGGLLKKSLLSDLPGPSAQSFYLCKVNEGDTLLSLTVTNGNDEIFLATKNGMAIRFSEADIRPMGLIAAGVNGVKLDAGDEVIGMELYNKQYELFVITSDGKAKRIDWDDFPVQGRYGRGVTLWNLPAGAKVAGVATGKGNYQVTIHLLKAAPKMIRLDEASLKKRSATRADPVVEVKEGDTVVGITHSWAMDKAVVMETTPKPKAEPKATQPELLSSTVLKNGRAKPSKVETKPGSGKVGKPIGKTTTKLKPPKK